MAIGKLTALLALAGIASTRPRMSRADIDTRWCGQILTGNDFQSVEATWTVPFVHEPPPAQQDPSGYYFSSQWVGIDGIGECGTILQAGTEMNFDKDGKADYYKYSWVEFYPDEVIELGLDFKSGDEIYTKVVAHSKTTGTVYMENKTTGKKVTKDVTASKGELCFKYAEWIEECPGGDELPFAAWDKFRFTGSIAHDSQGNTFNLHGSDSDILARNGTTLCTPTVIDDTTIEFNYGSN